MALQPGAWLGAYQILAPAGAGGMGEVYRARDTRLGREVALKVLPDHFARDQVRLQRFEREARLLASLNHPLVETIHGLEEAEGVRFLVLELVPGRTLAELLASGPLDVPEALRIGLQVAEALEAVHANGIIHRDLKPDNIEVTPDGRIKLLDFGLGKALAEPGTAGSESPTLTADATHAGTVMGTPAYMSPEQTRGRAADARTDLWALGCVLYEMLSGRSAFRGETTADTVAAILDREPDWSLLPRTVPEAVRVLLRQCLTKDRELRLREAAEARRRMETALGKPAAPAAARPWARPVLAAAGLLLATALVVLYRRGDTTTSPAPARLSQLTFAEGIEGFPAWSPDGRQLAFSAEAGGVRKIFLSGPGPAEARPLTRGAFDDIQPAWSHDGAMVLFVRARQAGKPLQPGDVFGEYDDGDVWEVEAGSGRETKLVDNAFNPAVSPAGDRIAVDAAWAGPHRIWTVDRRGLNPQQVTTDVSEAVAHVRPRWAPDGTRIVYQSIERTKFDVRVVDTASRTTTWVTNDFFQDVHPVWGPSGRFVYFSSYRSGGLNLWRVPLSADGEPSGPLQQLTTGAGQDVEAAVAPDGRRLAFSILRQNADIWRVPVSPRTGHPTGPPQQLVGTTREDSRGAWSPDGRAIAFNSDRGGEMNIWVRSLPDGAERPVTRGPGGDFQPSWSPDGKRIVFFSARSGAAQLWWVEVATGELRRLTHSPSIDVNPFFSPDGSRIAYHSDRSGRLEVWVIGADGTGARQLTRVGAGGHFLRWTRDGRHVVFTSPGGARPRTLRVPAAGGEAEPLPEVAGGNHISFSPHEGAIMDVVAHRALWVSPLASGVPQQVFAFGDAETRIDYPVWSPDGRWVLFDRFRPQGGDIWVMEILD